MGRSEKLSEAVTIPCDGPIHWFLQKTDKGGVAPDLEQHQGFVEALAVLSPPAGNSDASPSSPSRRLWNSLTTTKQICNQLQALQVYRSTLLHLKRSNGHEGSHMKDFVGTYRLLLECSLASDIPSAFRRAVQSSLEVLSAMLPQVSDAIRLDVVESIWSQQQVWINSVRTIFEALNYGPTKDNLFRDSGCCEETLKLLVRESGAVRSQIEKCSYVAQASDLVSVEMPFGAAGTLANAVVTSLEIAAALKIFMARVLSSDVESFHSLLESTRILADFLWSLVSCRATHSEDLNVVGVGYGQILLFQWKFTNLDASEQPTSIAICATDKLKSVAEDTNLPALNILSVVQGVAATLPDDVLLCEAPPIMQALDSYVLDQCHHAAESEVRLSSLRALQTLLNRCISILSSSSCSNQDFNYRAHFLADASLEVVLRGWESPPGRQVASAIPGVFNSVTRLLRALDSTDSSSLRRLVERILQQPPNRKGKYIGLETLLPSIGAKGLIDIAGNGLVASLVSCTGDRGNNAGAIAELLGKLLSQLRDQMDKEAGFVRVSSTLNKKQRRKMQKEGSSAGEDYMKVESDTTSTLLPAWVKLWAPHVALAIVSPSASRRKQSAAFCLPLVITIVGGPTRRVDAAYAFSALFDELDELLAKESKPYNDTADLNYLTAFAESLTDRALWAKLEIARQASSLKLVKTAESARILHEAFAKGIPYQVLRASLVHVSSLVRLTAFAAMEAIVPSYDTSSTPYQHALMESKLWEHALPYSLKTGGKEYTSSLLRSLTSFLDRLSCLEAEDWEKQQAGNPEFNCLPNLTSFVLDFLIGDLVLMQGAYPGTVQDKEGFTLALLRCILSFACQNTGETNSTGPKRRLTGVEIFTSNIFIKSLSSDAVIASLLTLLHSMWDNTRAASFTFLVDVMGQMHARGLEIADCLSVPAARSSIQRRALFLASSPRQREADTGARILAFLFTTFSDRCERDEYFEKLVQTLFGRVKMTEAGLSRIVRGFARQEASTNVNSDGRDLPLAYGLIKAVGLVIDITSSRVMGNHRLSSALHQQIAQICCQAIQISLNVVADTKKDTTTDKDDLAINDKRTNKNANTPLNVNTGAIGANATYSSIQPTDEQTVKHLGMQRVVVGSWLQTKEACAGLASAVASDQFDPPVPLVEHSGSLLIKTQTSLKHQGAAFAAHKALQQIAFRCSIVSAANQGGNLLSHLPQAWSDQLMHEIASPEEIRDSTLRRSTGYALGFLSLMRSDVARKTTPKILCSNILSQIIRLSLPSDVELGRRFSHLKLESSLQPSDSAVFAFPSVRMFESGVFVPEVDYEWRSRVHALNILRHAVLDAPLASELKPFLGDALISSIVGYNDTMWAVRNSATMVFAAVMLRLIDSDKNACKKDATSGNAITASELFRCYRSLPAFLTSVMVEDRLYVDTTSTDYAEHMARLTVEERSRMLHPPLYPILLLLSRLQPVAFSGTDAAQTEQFIRPTLDCLRHHHHKVRVVAARALANLANGTGRSEGSTANLVNACCQLLNTPGADWNTRHGALLGLRYFCETSLENSPMLWDTIIHEASGFANLNHGRTPPPCVSVALETLGAAVARSSDSEPLDRDRVVKSCLQILDELSLRPGVTKNLIGASGLTATAAIVACTLCNDVIWDLTTDYGQFVRYCEILSKILEHDLIDVRLAGVKAFKKPITTNLDALLAEKRRQKDELIERLSYVLTILLNGVCVEVGRGRKSDLQTSSSFGSHQPTLRRVSRCIIECAHALRTLDYDLASKGYAWTMWDVGMQMINASNDFSEHDSFLSDSENLLKGNAIELMSFLIASEQLRRSPAADILSKAELFVKAIDSCNKIVAQGRFSLAIALSILTSRIFSLQIHGHNDGTAGSVKQLKELQLFGFITEAKLLQDGCPNVRSLVTRALSSAGISDSQSGVSVSLETPERCFAQISAYATGFDLIKRLLLVILDGCCDLLPNIQLFQKEYAQSRDLHSCLELTNLATERKIFEEEEANSYDEVLLLNQLLAGTIVISDCPALGDSTPESNTILSQCHLVLEHCLQQEINEQGTPTFPDFVHEITRNGFIFPLLQSMVLGCIAVIYHGAADLTGIREKASRIVIALEEQTTAIHPCIIRTLRVLAKAREKAPETRDGLLECLFLVPGRTALASKTSNGR